MPPNMEGGGEGKKEREKAIETPFFCVPDHGRYSICPIKIDGGRGRGNSKG